MSTSSKSFLPAVIVVLALLGFMVTSFLHLSGEINSIKQEVATVQKDLGNQIATQAEKILIREASIRAMSDDLTQKGEKLDLIERSLQTDRETTRKLLSSVDETFATQRGMIEDIQRTNKELEARVKKVVEVQQFAQENAQKEVQFLQRETADIKKQMLMMRESSLLTPASLSTSRHNIEAIDPFAIPAPAQN